MGRLIRCSSFLLVLMTAFAVVPGTAQGERPVERFHDHFSESFSDVVCEIPVDIDIVVNNNFFFYADGSFKNTGSFKATLTNPVNGNSVVQSSAGQTTGQAIVDEEAGTVTFLNTFIGLPEKIRTANGPVLTRDAGIITFADTFDLETGEFLGSDVTVNRGPHPEADSDFELFCEVVAGALN